MSKIEEKTEEPEEKVKLPEGAVRVAEGALRGRRVDSRTGGVFWSFQGIPYARPPLGPLRFKDAQPMEPWKGVRDAFRVGSNCTQFEKATNKYIGSEDCLFLNVFTPRLPREAAALLPVMVFVHGGGFEFGCGDTYKYGPDYLLAENVVFVTFNYRLGVLGFLYLGNEAPGNTGLKDQVAALRWVQTNIAAFGGDPGNVTLFGESAGGVSVHYQMLSPMSEGLFHRAIAMSGAALNPWAVQTQPEETARRLARALGCTEKDDDAIVQFLRGVFHRDLVRAAHTDAVPVQDKSRFLKFSFVPTPEKIVPDVETFLPASVERLMKDGRHHDIPYITGMTGLEALILLGSLDIRNVNSAEEIDNNWESNVLPELRLPDDERMNAIALDTLRQFYMKGDPLSKDTMYGFLNMLSDIAFGEGVACALRNIVKSNTAPVYQYIFTADDKLNSMKVNLKIDAPGASHGDDLGYLFYRDYLEHVPPDSSAAHTRQRFVRLWTNFAKTGNPTPKDDPLLGVCWKPYIDEDRNYLEIGNKLLPGTNLNAERVAFWEKFYTTFAS